MSAEDAEVVDWDVLPELDVDETETVLC